MKQSKYNIWQEHDGRAYVYNGTTGSLLSMSTTQRDMLENRNFDLDADLLEKLAHGRMIVPNDTDELQLLQNRFDSARNDVTNFALTIVTSLGCNFDCPYCFEAKHPSILSPSVEAAVLTMLDAQIERGIRTFNVTWYGGEPLVGKRPLMHLSDAFLERCGAASVGYSASIVTNGYLLDGPTARDLRDRNVTSAQVTIDGPPDIHDAMRPLAGGGPSFWTIVRNVQEACSYINISIRVNIDKHNVDRAEDLLKILRGEQLAGKVTVYPAQLVASDYGGDEPSATYTSECFRSAEYAHAALAFQSLARDYGFAGISLPSPTTTPCTATNRNELIVGSKGELYKCWESVGNAGEVVGSIFGYDDKDARLTKWLKYSPFEDAECRECIALPVCMGGCGTHAMSEFQYENRCGTFRHTYQEQMASFIRNATGPRRSTLPIVAVRSS